MGGYNQTQGIKRTNKGRPKQPPKLGVSYNGKILFPDYTSEAERLNKEMDSIIDGPPRFGTIEVADSIRDIEPEPDDVDDVRNCDNKLDTRWELPLIVGLIIGFVIGLVTSV